MRIPGNPTRHKARQKAFTVVEIIVTIILVGIMAAFTMSRFLDSNAFNPSIVRDQIISLSRTAQQSALGRPDVTLTITPNASGDEVTIDVEANSGATTILSVTTSLSGVSLSGDINKTASCDADDGDDTIDDSNVMVLSFGELGDLEDSGVGAGVGAITSAVRICINNRPEDSVCVSPSGFAYAGDCDV